MVLRLWDVFRWERGITDQSFWISICKSFLTGKSGVSGISRSSRLKPVEDIKDLKNMVNKMSHNYTYPHTILYPK